MSVLIAAVEGGGTNFNCAVFEETGSLVSVKRVATTDPWCTVEQCVAFVRSASAGRSVAALGLACFGPLELAPDNANYGQVLATPKVGWEGFNIRRAFESALEVPVAMTTDVGGSALGEQYAGAAQEFESFVYVTVGTGIGAAVVNQGALLSGASHFELGHISVRRRPDDVFPGNCPFHGDCVSGLASGPAIEARWETPGTQLSWDHPAWDLESYYLAELCASVIYSHAPQALILGGGVMEAPGLRERVRHQLGQRLANYHCAYVMQEDGLPRVLAPGIGARSALHGAFALALGIR